MSRVLVLDPNAALVGRIVQCLSDLGVLATGRTHPDPARPVIRCDVALIDSSLESHLDRIAARHLVLMTSYPDPSGALSRSYIILPKPFTRGELTTCLRRVGLDERRPDQTLLRALMAKHEDRASARLTTTGGGEVVLVDGELYDARRGALRGQDALCALLAGTDRVDTSVHVGCAVRSLRGDFRTLVIAALARIEAAEERATTNMEPRSS